VIFPFGIPGQTIPFALDSDFDAGLPGESAFDVEAASAPTPTASAPVPIPLTSDLVDTLTGHPATKKKAGHA
jgi:hypothetical protein